jgi:hypothetical protein
MLRPLESCVESGSARNRCGSGRNLLPYGPGGSETPTFAAQLLAVLMKFADA